jgi:hypothetical protein
MPSYLDLLLVFFFFQRIRKEVSCVIYLSVRYTERHTFLIGKQVWFFYNYMANMSGGE